MAVTRVKTAKGFQEVAISESGFSHFLLEVNEYEGEESKDNFVLVKGVEIRLTGKELKKVIQTLTSAL